MQCHQMELTRPETLNQPIYVCCALFLLSSLFLYPLVFLSLFLHKFLISRSSAALAVLLLILLPVQWIASEFCVLT